MYTMYLPKLLEENRVFAVLMGVTVVYLFWQVSLSAAILTAGTLEESQRLSRLAKFTVGFGSALLVLRMLALRKAHLCWLILLPLVAGYVAVWTEDAIVDTFAERATGEDRRDAQQILLFNDGLINGVVTLEDLAPHIAAHPVQVRAFAKVLGFAVWHNPALMGQVRNLNLQVLDALTLPAIYKKIDEGYARYVAFAQKQGQELAEAQRSLNTMPFENMTIDLNRALNRYNNCGKNTQCRKAIQERTNRELANRNITVPVRLEAFCGDDGMGCVATPKAVYEYFLAEMDAMVQPALDELHRKEGVAPGTFTLAMLNPILTQEAWRQRMVAAAQKTLAQEQAQRFQPAEHYAEGGVLAREGKDFCIAVFLPPVALGFSVIVCFLHITNVAVVFFGHARLFSGLAAAVLAWPLLFGPSLPLAGLSGMYARWLVFWESTIYPYAIFKNLIL